MVVASSIRDTPKDRPAQEEQILRVAQLRVLGGAMARVPAEATVFAHRASRIIVNVAAFYEGLEDKIARDPWSRRSRQRSVSPTPGRT